MALELREYRERPRIGVIAGYAGTGKTTLLKYVIEALISSGAPVVVAPTGKAALRVREATGISASTIHSWLYRAVEIEGSGEVTFEMKDPVDVEPDDSGSRLVIIDEASMVDKDIWNHIWDMCVVKKLNILVVGDAFQLPPVKVDERDTIPFSLLSEHFHYDKRVVLTEVMRQALDSPIIRASMMIRNGRAPEAMLALKRIKSTDLVEVSAKLVRSNGIVICHRNETRAALNMCVRKATGQPENVLSVGEPLLVLQNNYALMRFNGEIAVFKGWREEPRSNHRIYNRFEKEKILTSRFGVAQLDIIEQEPTGIAVLCEEQIFGRTGKASFKSIESTAAIIHGKPGKGGGWPVLHANLAYAMTCHKSQGSEWDNVLVCLEPSVRLGDEEGRRWFYTAVTRAKESVLLCLGVPQLKLPGQI
jgi:exodeoxyribonuclease-5